MHFCHVWSPDRNFILLYCRRWTVFGAIPRALSSETLRERSDLAIVESSMCSISRWVSNRNCFCGSNDFSAYCKRCTSFAVVDWGELALEQGYFDQSHLIRDFVAFSGLSPADYLRRLHDFRNDGTNPIKFNHLPLAG